MLTVIGIHNLIYSIGCFICNLAKNIHTKIIFLLHITYKLTFVQQPPFRHITTDATDVILPVFCIKVSTDVIVVIATFPFHVDLKDSCCFQSRLNMKIHNR
jgi:hypothetical protein